MICKSCGGEYRDEDLHCPFCNSENPKAAYNLEKEIMQGYEEEAEDIRQNLPTRVVKKGTRVYIKALLILLGAAVLIAVFVSINSRRGADKEYEEQKKTKEILEAMFQAGNIKEMSEYIDDNHIYKSYYQKYMEIDSVYHKMEIFYSWVDCYVDFSKNREPDHELVLDSRKMVIECAQGVLLTSREYCEDTKVLGNEDVIRSMEEEVIQKMEQLGFTKEEYDS